MKQWLEIGNYDDGIYFVNTDAISKIRFRQYADGSDVGYILKVWGKNGNKMVEVNRERITAIDVSKDFDDFVKQLKKDKGLITI